ncbi:hypothetical protein ACFE04_018504 [Oxalis oulophora]
MESCSCICSSNGGGSFLVPKSSSIAASAAAAELSSTNWVRVRVLHASIKSRGGGGGGGVRASAVDSYEGSSNFIKRMEQTWLITQQPRPISCSSCDSKGNVECKWCAGTGFFILGDNMLCQVPSKNSTCVICVGKGSMCCSDCKGTGFRAKWLGEPPISK